MLIIFYVPTKKGAKEIIICCVLLVEKNIYLKRNHWLFARCIAAHVAILLPLPFVRRESKGEKTTFASFFPSPTTFSRDAARRRVAYYYYYWVLNLLICFSGSNWTTETCRLWSGGFAFIFLPIVVVTSVRSLCWMLKHQPNGFRPAIRCRFVRPFSLVSSRCSSDRFSEARCSRFVSPPVLSVCKNFYSF